MLKSTNIPWQNAPKACLGARSGAFWQAAGPGSRAGAAVPWAFLGILLMRTHNLPFGGV